MLRRLRSNKKTDRLSRHRHIEGSIDSVSQSSLQSGNTPIRGILKTDQDSSSNSRNSSNNSPGANSRGVERSRRRVTFRVVEVREYERTLGDNPSCSSGAPITIGWEYAKGMVKTVDDYEKTKPTFKLHTSELILSRQDREELLLDWGATFQDIIEAIRTNVRVKNQRRRTVSSIGTYDKWEEALEKAGRKIKRTLKRQPKSSKPALNSVVVNSSGAPSSPAMEKPPKVVNGMLTASEHTSKTGNRSGVSPTSSGIKIPFAEQGTRDGPQTSDSVKLQQVGDPHQPSTQQRQQDTETPLRPNEAIPMMEIDVWEEDLSEFNTTISGSHDGDESAYLDLDDLGSVESTEFWRKLHKPPQLDELRRDNSCWEVTKGVDGPVIRKRVSPVIIYEESDEDLPHPAYAPELAMKSPSRSGDLLAAWF